MVRTIARMFPIVLMTMVVGCAADAVETETQEAALDSTCLITDGTDGRGNFFGGGLLIGSKTDYYTLDSKAYLRSKSWGFETQNYAVIAQGLSSDGTGASYTTLYFSNNPGENGAYVIVGGEQQYWPTNNPSRIAKDASWGISSGAGVFPVDSGIDTLAYYPAWGWGGSRIIFYVKRAQDNPCAGDQVMGGEWLSRDLQSKQNFTSDAVWGFPGGLGNPKIWLGTGQAWSYQYGWGQSVYYLYLGNNNHSTPPGY